MVRDTKRRENEARDSREPFHTVRTSSARNKIYVKGKGVKSQGVEDLLYPESLVPSSVCYIHLK